MWWEIMPPVAIMFTCFTAPEVFAYYWQWWWHKTPFKRSDLTHDHVLCLLRDERLSGDKKINMRSRYKFVGLENIPDEPTPGTSAGAKKEC